MNVSVDVSVPIGVNVSVDVSVPINVDVSVDVNVPIDVGVFSVVIPAVVTVSAMVVTVSRRYNYSRAVTTTTVIATIVVPTTVIAATVVATVIIATRRASRINFTRLKSQGAEGQRKDRKQ